MLHLLTANVLHFYTGTFTELMSKKLSHFYGLVSVAGHNEIRSSERFQHRLATGRTCSLKNCTNYPSLNELSLHSSSINTILSEKEVMV